MKAPADHGWGFVTLPVAISGRSCSILPGLLNGTPAMSPEVRTIGHPPAKIGQGFTWTTLAHFVTPPSVGTARRLSDELIYLLGYLWARSGAVVPSPAFAAGLLLAEVVAEPPRPPGLGLANRCAALPGACGP